MWIETWWGLYDQGRGDKLWQKICFKSLLIGGSNFTRDHRAGYWILRFTLSVRWCGCKVYHSYYPWPCKLTSLVQSKLLVISTFVLQYKLKQSPKIFTRLNYIELFETRIEFLKRVMIPFLSLIHFLHSFMNTTQNKLKTKAMKKVKTFCFSQHDTIIST